MSRNQCQLQVKIQQRDIIRHNRPLRLRSRLLRSRRRRSIVWRIRANTRAGRCSHRWRGDRCRRLSRDRLDDRRARHRGHRRRLYDRCLRNRCVDWCDFWGVDWDRGYGRVWLRDRVVILRLTLPLCFGDFLSFLLGLPCFAVALGLAELARLLVGCVLALGSLGDWAGTGAG